MTNVFSPHLFRAMRFLPIMLLLSCSLAGGCGTQAWQRYSESPANPAVWVRSVFPPDGEYFYNNKSHEIERSLSREQSVDLMN